MAGSFSCYCSIHSSEISDLMTHAQIVQDLARSCDDDDALAYDENFATGVKLPVSPVHGTQIKFGTIPGCYGWG